MGPSKRTGLRGLAIALALCATFTTTAQLGWAETSATNPAQLSADYESALAAYTAGNIAKALALASQAANAGSTDAAVMAGHILRAGETGRVDLSAARKWYEKAAMFGHPDALVALGEMGVREQAGLTKTNAVSYLTRAADAGRTDAMRALADLYRTGQGVKADPIKSQNLLRKASQSFDKDATKRLGDSLLESNPKAALVEYERAAAAGHIEAAYIAGIMYAENFEIRPDNEKSARYLRMAAEGGHAGAQADYGLLVYQGYGAKKSASEAAQWFAKSAAGGDSEGQFLYAFTLAKGDGITQDFEEAYYWLLKSGASGVDDYDRDKTVLRERLEDNVDPEVLARAKARL